MCCVPVLVKQVAAICPWSIRPLASINDPCIPHPTVPVIPVAWTAEERSQWLIFQFRALICSHARIMGQNGWPLPLLLQRMKLVVVPQGPAILQQALAWPLSLGQAMAAGWLATMQPQSSSWNSLRSSHWGHRRPGSPRMQVGSALTGADVHRCLPLSSSINSRHLSMVLTGICAVDSLAPKQAQGVGGLSLVLQ